MANSFGTLYIGQSGLVGAQNALNTTANNLANVNTAGYVRQQVRFADKNYENLKDPITRVNMQQAGHGVTIGDVVHARDIFLDKAFRQETGREAFYSKCYEVTGQVENLLQELDGEQFAQSLNDLYQAIEEIAKNPADSTIQNLMLQKCELFLTRSTALYSDLKSYQSNLDTQISDNVKKVNEMGNRIYELNLQIQKVEASGVETAMTLRDERDYLVDQLAAIVKTEVKEDATGFLFVDIEGAEFVTERGAEQLALQYRTETGFSDPYWVSRTNLDTGDYTYLFDMTKDATTETNTDIGELKALMIQRGDHFGTYKDMESLEAYSAIQSSSAMETEAEIDQLVHKVVTMINDLYCPNTSVADQENALRLVTKKVAISDDEVDDIVRFNLVGEKSQSGVYYNLGRDQNNRTIVVAVEGQVLDTKNAYYGADGNLPPNEIFARNTEPRYVEVTVNGEKLYVYNAERADEPDSYYHIGTTAINSNLKKQITLMPAFTKNGAVAYDFGAAISEAWASASLTLNPTDANVVNIQQYYNKMVSKLAIDGNVYSAATDTLTATRSSLDNARQQQMGVSSDEELTHMIKFQSAYNAASRFMTVVSDMTETIVSLI